MTFKKIKCHNLQDLEGARCYVVGIKKLKIHCRSRKLNKTIIVDVL